MKQDKPSITSRLANAGLLVRAAVAEMLGRTDGGFGNGMGAMGKIRATFSGYKEVSTYDISRTSYSLARAIFYANLYTDRKTGKEYGKEYLLGAPFAKPIVNIAAGFAVGSPVQIAESSEVTEDDDTSDSPNAKPVKPNEDLNLDDPQDPTNTPQIDPANEDEEETISLISSPTVANTNRMLQDRRDSIFKAVRNSYRDGDSFIVVDDDGEFTEIPPEDIDVITNPSNPDSIDGYDIFSSFPDPADPSGAQTITYVDEIRRAFRRRCVIDKSQNRKLVPGTLVEYRNAGDGGLEERELPVVHFANEREARALYGVSEYQNLYYLMANYHAILSAAIKGNIYNSTAVPVIQGVKNMQQFLKQNFKQDKDGNYVLKWDNQKMLVVGDGGSVQILQANGTATDAQTLLNILFWLIAQSSETPEFAFGTAVQSSKASVSEQTPMLIKKAVRKQGELEVPLRKLVELYINRMAAIKPNEFDDSIEFTIEMPNILDEDLNINIQIVNALLEKGIITEETAMTMLNIGKYVKNFEEERKRAQAQKTNRSPIPTDVFGQPLNSNKEEDLNAGKATATLKAQKQKEIDTLKKNNVTKNVGEMLEKNIDALSLEQIREMIPDGLRGSEGTNPKAIQEQLKVKSGNPYRQAGGKFGYAPANASGQTLQQGVGNNSSYMLSGELDSMYLTPEARQKITKINKDMHSVNDLNSYLSSKGIKLKVMDEGLLERADDPNLKLVTKQAREIVATVEQYQSFFGPNSTSNLKQVEFFNDDITAQARFLVRLLGEKPSKLEGTLSLSKNVDGFHIMHEFAHVMADSYAPKGDDVITYSKKLMDLAKIPSYSEGYFGQKAAHEDAEIFANAITYAFVDNKPENRAFATRVAAIVNPKNKKNVQEMFDDDKDDIKKGKKL